MILLLSDRLEVPLRERNAWLVAVGFSPAFRARPWIANSHAIATFGTAQDVTADEPRIDLLFAADGATEELFRASGPAAKG